MSSSALSFQKEWLIKYCLSDTIKRYIKLYFFPVMKHMDLHRLSLSTGIPILMQLAASKVSGRGRSSHLGNCSCIKMRGFDLAMLYSCLQRSFSRTSHSSRHSSRGLGVRERSSHRGNTKWQKEGIANCEHWSDKCVEVPIMVNAAAEEQKYRWVLIHSMRKNLIFMSFALNIFILSLRVWKPTGKWGNFCCKGELTNAGRKPNIPVSLWYLHRACRPQFPETNPHDYQCSDYWLILTYKDQKQRKAKYTCQNTGSKVPNYI